MPAAGKSTKHIFSQCRRGGRWSEVWLIFLAATLFVCVAAGHSRLVPRQEALLMSVRCFLLCHFVPARIGYRQGTYNILNASCPYASASRLPPDPVRAFQRAVIVTVLFFILPHHFASVLSKPMAYLYIVACSKIRPHDGKLVEMVITAKQRCIQLSNGLPWPLLYFSNRFRK